MIVDVSRDWVLACDVQQRFMQSLDRMAGTLDYSGRCRQLQALGGDCYGFSPLADGRLALTIGDASGHGLASALMISNVQSSLRTAAWLSGNKPDVALRAVNRQVYTSSLDDRHATLFYGVFDQDTRTLEYVNAGHNPPMVVRQDGSVIWLRAGGLPVGMFPHATYEQNAVELDPGDLVVAYTDGVTEAISPAGEEWGVDGLLRAVTVIAAPSAEAIVSAIFDSMDEFSRGRQTDDATVVVLQVH
jgi:sigma-B regulation protein RsbU (phosphoserine phosphatase)